LAEAPIMRFAKALAISLALVALWNFSISSVWAASCDAPTPIKFQRGSSAGIVGGAVARGEIDCWTFVANAGQTAHVTISSTEKNAVFQIYRPGWKIAHNDSDRTISGRTFPGTEEGADAMTWSGPLTENGANLIVVGATRGGADYKLTLEIGK
jgi:hypothetical protein